MIRHEHVSHHTDRLLKIWSLFIREETSALGPITLLAQYIQREGMPDQIELKYYLKGCAKLGPMGEINFKMEDGRVMDCTHRFVIPDIRRRAHIGSQLLARAESVFQAVANADHAPVRMRMRLAQRSVILWAQKNGFNPSYASVRMMRAIIDHPEKFDIRTIIDERDKSEKPDFVFLPGTQDFRYNTAVRVQLEKIIPPESIDWDTEKS